MQKQQYQQQPDDTDDVSTDGTTHHTDLGNEDEEEDGAVGVDEALVLLPGATAAKEGNGEDNTSYIILY